METFMSMADEAMAVGDRMAAHWKFVDACEHALDKYRLALIEAGRKDELSDDSVRYAVIKAFYGAAIPEQLDEYMSMTPAEIVSMVAARIAAVNGPDREKMRRLYALLRETAQDDHDLAASLVWAISIIERRYREQPMDAMSQIIQCAAKPEPEINGTIDTGIFKEIVKGYAVIAMQGAMIDREKILDAVKVLEDAFKDIDAAAARKAYREL